MIFWLKWFLLKNHKMICLLILLHHLIINWKKFFRWFRNWFCFLGWWCSRKCEIKWVLKVGNWFRLKKRQQMNNRNFLCVKNELWMNLIWCCWKLLLFLFSMWIFLCLLNILLLRLWFCFRCRIFYHFEILVEFFFLRMIFLLLRVILSFLVLNFRLVLCRWNLMLNGCFRNCSYNNKLILFYIEVCLFKEIKEFM